MSIATVYITSNVEKLWKCPEMNKRQGQHKGKKPLSAGMPINILIKSANKQPWCDTMTWEVVHDELLRKAESFSVKFDGGNRVCQHQVDTD